MSKTDLVVYGCPVAERGWVLNDWKDAIDQQWLPTNVETRTVCVYTESTDDTLDILNRRDVIVLDGLVGATRPLEELRAHRWPLEHIEWMAGWRNQLLQYCRDVGAEWFFSVDSDIILEPLATTHLIAHLQTGLLPEVVAMSPLVNMAEHLDPGTFAWNYMSWNDGAGVISDAYRTALPMPDVPFRAGVIMAAVLIHRSAFDVEYKAHPQGEDIGWSWNLAQRGMKLMVDPHVMCEHRMVQR